jgi:methyl-accepting chemotaxis protein
MANALNRTLDRVGNAVARIAEDARTLTAAAGGLTTVSHQVSTGAQQVTSQSAVTAENATKINDDLRAIAAASLQSVVAQFELADATTPSR